MKSIIFSLLILLVSCNKQDQSYTCGLTGTWQQVIKIPGEPDQVSGLKIELLEEGSMKLLGLTGFLWRVKDNCQIFEYWAKADPSITSEMKILQKDGNYLSLELLGGALSGSDPLGIFNPLELKRIK